MTRIAKLARNTIGFLRAAAAAVPHTSRSLRRAPGFVAIATLSLGAALGLSTSVFALIDAMTHPESPYTHVEQLFEVRVFGNAKVSPSARDIREALKGIDGIARMTMATFTFSDVQAGDAVSKVAASHVQPEFFETLGAHARLGRLPSVDEAREGKVALVSDDFWRQHFRNRNKLDGDQLTIGDNVYTIIGVLRPNSNEPLNTSVWIPDATDAANSFGIPVVRLRPGVTERDIQPKLDAIMKRLTQIYVLGPGDRPFAASLETLRPNPLALRDFHRAMIGAALCVLLIACANVAALMLSRGAVRRRDYALRLALGASRGDIAREVLFEVSALAGIGCVAGSVVAAWAVGLMTRATPVEMKWIGFVQPQWSARVLGMSAAAVLLAVAIAGGLPAWQASRTDPAATLKESSGGNTGRAGTRFRWLVMAELALSMTLLVGISLMVKSVVLMAHYDFGFDAKRIFDAQVYLRNLGSSTPTSTLATLNQEALSRIRAVPGVESAAMIAPCVFDHPMVTTDRTIEGGEAATLPRCENVTTGYMRTLGYTMAEGRDFEDGDALGNGAAILDQKTAKALFPHESALGRTLKLGNLASHQPWLTVVGVVRDKSVDFRPFPERGVDSTQVLFVSVPDSSRDMHAFPFRIAPGAKDVRIGVSNALIGMLPPATYTRVVPWTDTYDAQLSEERFLTIVFTLLGVASLVLGAAGLFSVVSYIAGQRMREFAVRVALGATRENVATLVLGEAFLMALGGTAVGAGLGMWAGFLIWDKMYGVYPVDVTSLVAAEATLLVVTMAACAVPALRATRANPVDVMRAI
ncbi:MAG TPA: ABC transporter permease [Gemmatimonadaceae bacterium]